jgi:hypothetical protein
VLVIVNQSSGCVLCGKVVISEVMYHFDKANGIKGMNRMSLYFVLHCFFVVLVIVLLFGDVFVSLV